MMVVVFQLEFIQKQVFQRLKQFIQYYMLVVNLVAEDTRYLVVYMV